jgi:hypothetical protein
MSKTRIWRIGTAALAASALLMATVGGATAQSLNDLTDVLDREEASTLADALSGDGESDSSALDGLLDQLGLDTVEDLLDQLGLDSLDELLVVLQTIAAEDPEVQDGEAAEGDVPEAGIGGFIGRAEGTALEIGVGLPAELAEASSRCSRAWESATRTPVASASSSPTPKRSCSRAAEGEDIEGLAKALRDQPPAGLPEGSRAPGPAPAATPSRSRRTRRRRSCGSTSPASTASRTTSAPSPVPRSPASTISLAGLIEAGFPEDIRDGFDEAITGFNESAARTSSTRTPATRRRTATSTTSSTACSATTRRPATPSRCSCAIRSTLTCRSSQGRPAGLDQRGHRERRRGCG